MTTVAILADAKVRKEQALSDEQALMQQHAQIEAELNLSADFFMEDAQGQCAQLTVAGFNHYAPRFEKHRVYLTGQESFRDMQRRKQEVLQPYEDQLDEITRQNIRTGKLKGKANMQIALASLDGDMEGVVQRLGALADTMEEGWALKAVLPNSTEKKE